MQTKLLVQVSLTENEFPHCKQQLMSSLHSLLETLVPRVSILIVYQSESGFAPPELSNLNSAPVQVEITALFSVSAARNRGIERALELNCRYILFHDAKVSYNKSFLNMTKQAMLSDLDLCRGKVMWRNQESPADQTSQKPQPADNQSTDKNEISTATFVIDSRQSPRRQRLNPIMHTYIWAYLIKVDLLRNIRFNENLGPGENTKLNAGEDTLFLCDLAGHHPQLRIWYFPQAKVMHPPRPGDLSKHHAYARAQGVMFRFFLSHGFQPYWYFLLYLSLFSGVALMRIMLLRHNSWKSAREFISGLIDRENQRALLQSNPIAEGRQVKRKGEMHIE